MSKTRRCIGLDMDLAEELKNISKSRGMSIVGYMRKLLEEVIELEKFGYYVPEVLYEKRIELILSKLGFVYIPTELVEITVKPEEAEVIGEKIGKALAELGIDVVEFIERFALRNDLAIVQRSSLVLVPTSSVKKVLTHLLIGMAKTADIDVSSTGDVVIFRLKSKHTQII
ncbi:MAG: CopG family transcriptional regulator [Ignisphaera sp.]|uniref:CopG family transcriptional regulator n=1 Tax=Ignisphaera aggregans TaxID=334771 RepID=A0A7C4NQW2_9CREN